MTDTRQTASPPVPVVETRRIPVAGSPGTSLHVLRLPRAHFTARVVVLEPNEPLVDWCARNAAEYALIGGFYIRAEGIPLGELRVDGLALPSIPFDPPWGRIRACVHSHEGEVALSPRHELPDEPSGDLLQAGPMLVAEGAVVVQPGADDEGFSAGSRQFDSDITLGRYPRAALGLSRTELIAAVCDGRAADEAGLDLGEFAEAMIDLGAEQAINLDGGGSASLIVNGSLVNTPRQDDEIELVGGRAVATALRFTPR
jgi:Phosphodiester glycosidase